MKSHRWKIALALAGIFLAGAVVGLATGFRMAQYRQQAWLRSEGWDSLVLQRMEDRLRLSEEQKTALQPLVKDAAQRLQAQRRRALIEQLQTIRGLYEEAEPHLTPEQKERLAQSRQRLRDRLQQENPVLPPRVQRPGGGNGIRPLPPAPEEE